MNNLSSFICFIGALVVSILSAYLMGRFGKTWGFIDKPNERSSHNIPTPRGGGIGIWITMLLCSKFIIQEQFVFIIVLCVGLTALLEDRFNISKFIRLFIYGLFSIAAVLVLLGRPHSSFNLIILLLFIIFIFTTTNIYNFMDGINGIAGITGMISFLLLAFFGYAKSHNIYITVMSIAVATACAGFLPFNVPRARVFMGDVGSIMLGFMFAFFVLLIGRNSGDLLCLISFLFPFYADGLMTIALRLKNKENIFKAHRRHLYQILANEKQIPHWKVAAVYGLFQIAVGLSMMVACKMGLVVSVIVLLMWFAGFIVIARLVRIQATCI